MGEVVVAQSGVVMVAHSGGVMGQSRVVLVVAQSRVVVVLSLGW